MSVVVILLTVVVVIMSVEVVRVRHRLSRLEKGREVVDRHLGHLAWRLDGEPSPEPSDQHLVVTLREHEPERRH
jgi:hypothetical protein